MSVQAIIQAAGQGTRLGLGPKAFVRLGQRTLREHAVQNLCGAVDHILVALPHDRLEEARRLSLPPRVAFIAGGRNRAETTRLLAEEAHADWLVLHDVVHPFIPAGLVADLLAAARQAGASAAAPALPTRDFLFDRSGRVLLAPGAAQLGQKPVVINRAALLASYAAMDATPRTMPDPSIHTILQEAGHRTIFLEGSSHNFKITTPEDLTLARALLAVLEDEGPQPAPRKIEGA